MIKTAKLEVPHAMIVISDPTGGTVPTWTGIPRVVATDSCIVVVCLHQIDGETEVTLGEADEIDPGWPPIFYGDLLTPSRRIVLETSEHHTILEGPTSQTTTKVRVWTNRPAHADKVIIGIG